MNEQIAVQDPEVDETAEQADATEEPSKEDKPAKPEPVSPLTPYQATKQVNEALRKAGVIDPKTGKPKEVRSPMLYIYAGKGAFKIHPAIKIGKNGKESTVHEVDVPSFLAWVEEYVGGVITRVLGAKDDEAKAEAADEVKDEVPETEQQDGAEAEQDSEPAEAE